MTSTNERAHHIYAEELATRMGVSVRAARAWLSRAEAKHGPSVVGRIGKGRRLYTTEEALRQLRPGWRGPDKDFERRLQDCEATIDDATNETSALFAEIRTRDDRIRALEELTRRQGEQIEMLRQHLGLAPFSEVSGALRKVGT